MHFQKQIFAAWQAGAAQMSDHLVPLLAPDYLALLLITLTCFQKTHSPFYPPILINQCF